MTLLREIRVDRENSVSLTDVQLDYIAGKLRERLPSGGTFTLAHDEPATPGVTDVEAEANDGSSER